MGKGGMITIWYMNDFEFSKEGKSMKCPFCDKEMKKGIMYGDGRSGVHWNEGNKKVPFLEAMVGKGRLTVAKYSLTTFTIESYYCAACKKMVIDTDLED